MEYFKLYNDNLIPKVGLGVYTLKDESELRNVLQFASKANYELIDTAYFYENEEYIGRAIKDFNFKNFKIATKVWPSDFGAENTKRSIERSLKALQTDVLEIMYLHWPGDDSAESWKVLEDYYEQGVLKNIGVCNFYKEHLEKLSLTANIKPQIDQIETHPLLSLDNLIDYLKKEKIQPMAWSPLARGDKSLFENKIIDEIAKAHNVSIAQVILRYNIERDVCVIPRSTKENRIFENIDLFNFKLTDDEMKKIALLNEERHVSHSPEELDWLEEIRKK